jgi:transposase
MSRPPKVHTRQIVELNSTFGWSYPKIAARLGCTEKTVYRHIRKWRKSTPEDRLRENLKGTYAATQQRLAMIQALNDPTLDKEKRLEQKRLDITSEILSNWGKLYPQDEPDSQPLTFNQKLKQMNKAVKVADASMKLWGKLSELYGLDLAPKRRK